jgi:sporulation protein YlmC with PRC-barrel domain
MEERHDFQMSSNSIPGHRVDDRRGVGANSHKQVGSTTSATTHKQGEWRASKLAGVDVYNEANEKIGDIHDVILDRSGKVANVILCVGGVLGLGEHYVAVAFDKLKWVDQPVTSTTASTTSAPANAPATTSASDGTTRNHHWCGNVTFADRYE